MLDAAIYKYSNAEDYVISISIIARRKIGIPSPATPRCLVALENIMADIS